MVRVPLIKIVVNGADKTETILKDLVKLSFTDYANNKSDQIEIEVSGLFKRPKPQDQIKLYLGYESLQLVGLFKVKETKKSFKRLVIVATGVDFSNNLKVKRNITYEQVNISEIVKQVATRYELNVKCDFDDLYIKSLAQTNESDISFLNRIAGEYNAVFNIKNNTLYFLKKVKNSEKNELLPRYKIDINKCKDEVVITHSEKTFYNSVKVSWHDTKLNQRKEIYLPKDAAEPILIYKGNFANEDEARAKAQAKLEKANAGVVTGELTCEGEIIFAGGVLTLLNVNIEDDLEYSIKTVKHTFSKKDGWLIDVEFEN
jgi:uncharacterized protein